MGLALRYLGAGNMNGRVGGVWGAGSGRVPRGVGRRG